MKKLEDVGVLVARILMPILLLPQAGEKSPLTLVPNNIWNNGCPGFYAAAGDSA